MQGQRRQPDCISGRLSIRDFSRNLKPVSWMSDCCHSCVQGSKPLLCPWTQCRQQSVCGALWPQQAVFVFFGYLTSSPNCINRCELIFSRLSQRTTGLVRNHHHFSQLQLHDESVRGDTPTPPLTCLFLQQSIVDHTQNTLKPIPLLVMHSLLGGAATRRHHINQLCTLAELVSWQSNNVQPFTSEALPHTRLHQQEPVFISQTMPINK